MNGIDFLIFSVNFLSVRGNQLRLLSEKIFKLDLGDEESTDVEC